MSKLEVFYDFFWSKCHGILSNWTYTNTVSSFQAICRVRKKMENKIVFKIIQICLLITAFGLFLGYRCEGNGCKFSTHGVYNFTAVIFALLFSMWVEWLRIYCLETKTSTYCMVTFRFTAIVACAGGVSCPCNYDQFEKCCLFTITCFMMVASCFESTGHPKKTRLASGKCYKHRAYSWWSFIIIFTLQLTSYQSFLLLVHVFCVSFWTYYRTRFVRWTWIFWLELGIIL